MNNLYKDLHSMKNRKVIRAGRIIDRVLSGERLLDRKIESKVQGKQVEIDRLFCYCEWRSLYCYWRQSERHY
ncbi:hypothetical protein [Lyngbya sp. CCAP 1446/10]|uniref:hypothetical protein n=1 Tax=Lyngbya sp. CCAP 1446/10 TaxID=439293 RepID=UPI002237F919|nr:hypothetical protein [Lyngbya sp. CCAP 1446/10]